MSPERHKSLILIILATAGPIACVAGEPELARGRLVVEDFEAFTWGGEWATERYSRRADPRMKPVASPVHGGERACRLDVPRGESLTLVAQHGTAFSDEGAKPPLPLPGAPERVGLWVHGHKSRHRLWVRLLDGQDKAVDLPLGSVDFEGWKLLDAPVPTLAAPIGLRGLVVQGGDGALVFDDLTVATASRSSVYVVARPLEPAQEFADDGPVRLRVVVQSLAAERLVDRCEVSAFPLGSQGEPAARRSFWCRVQAGEPHQADVRLALPAGVFRVVTRVGAARHTRRLVVHPAAGRLVPGRIVREAERFARRGGSLVVYQSALSPAVVVETREPTLTLFRCLPRLGLAAPKDALLRKGGVAIAPGERIIPGVRRPPGPPGALLRPAPPLIGPTADGAKGLQAIDEPWVLLWFSGSPSWYHVRFRDGSPCPTFDVPFLLAIQRRPTSVQLEPEGLRLTFDGAGGRVVLMPLYGILRPKPSTTTRWKEDLDQLTPVVKWCRDWARALLAYPVDVREEWRLVPERDEVQVRVRYAYLDTPTVWGTEPLRLAPVPPLLWLARQAGLRVRFSRRPRASGCCTSVGPYAVVSDADGFTYTLSGLSRYVTDALADVPRGGFEPRIGQPRRLWALSSDVGKIPFWARHAGERGRLATEALLRGLLWPPNSQYHYDPAHRRLRARDGLVWHTDGERAAEAVVAEHLRGCWYAGHYAGLWPLLRRRWRHIQSLHATLATPGDWATLGLGSGNAHLDDKLNAAVYYARLAARLDSPEAYADAHLRAVKLLVAAYALTAGAPNYAARHGPWAAIAGLGDKPTALSRCWAGSLGLAPGPPTLVTRPSDAGYSLAHDLLPAYFRLKFRPGPLDLFGRSPAQWAKRALVATQTPDLGAAFRPVASPAGPFAGNYVYTVRPGPDGWPALAWDSHQAPSGGPLLFGTIGTARHTRGKLLRTRTLSPHLRVSVYQAIEMPPPPKAPETPQPPRPEPPPPESADDTPAPDPPRSTPGSRPGTGAPAT